MTGPDAAAGLYEAAPCGLLLASAEGQVLHANATLCRWLGCKLPDLQELRLQDLLTVGGRIFFQTHLAPLLRMQGSVAEVKLEFRRLDGSTVPVMLNMAEQPGPGGARCLHVAAFVAEDRHRYERELLRRRKEAEELLAQHARDQDALRAARQQAEDRAALAEQMMGIVSHDLRNPLSVVQMSAALLELSAPSDQQKTAIARIHRAVRRAERLISDLLDLSQARIGGGLHVRRVEVDLHQVVAEAVNELSAAFVERELRHLRIGSGTWPADADRVAQAVGNLVANAVAYGQPGQPVHITTESRPDAFHIRVHNHGPAIAPALRETLFQPMVRGDAQGGHRSVGLGLFIVREIARAHDGDVSVSSSAGDGTTFVIALGPAAAPAA